MMSFSILLAAVFLGLLLNNYRKDKGRHTLAKTLNAIALCGLAWWFGGTLEELYLMARDTEEILEMFRVGSGGPGEMISFAVELTDRGLRLGFIVVMLLMTGRSDQARRIFLWWTGLLMGVHLLGFGIVFLSLRFFNYELLIWLLTTTGIALGAGIGLIVLYRSPMMRAFFGQDQDDPDNVALPPSNPDPKPDLN